MAAKIFTFDELRDEYAHLWLAMTTKPDMVASVENAARKLLKSKDRYKAVEIATGVPAAVIAALHMRESNADFTTYLGNGEPLSKKTRLVPKGRGPFKSWEEGAIDALTYQGLDKVRGWNVERACYAFEAFNGFGYRQYHSIRSPYLWGGTNQQQSGKYVADGVWDGTVMDRQLGACPVMQRMIAIDASLAIGPVTAPIPDVPPWVAPKPDTNHGAIAGAVASAAGALLIPAGLPIWVVALGVAVVGFLVYAVLKARRPNGPKP